MLATFVVSIARIPIVICYAMPIMSFPVSGQTEDGED